MEEVKVCICGEIGCKVPYGLCHCGCGLLSPIPKKSDFSRRWIAGVPLKCRRGHHHRKPIPTDKDCLCGVSECVLFGFCHCGCGGKTLVSLKTVKKRNQVKGQPYLFQLGHKNKDKNDIRTEKLCRLCEKVLPISSFSKGTSQCKECINKRNKKKYWEDVEKSRLEGRENYKSLVERGGPRNQYISPRKRRDYYLKGRYGITLKDYEKLWEGQNGKCAICEKDLLPSRKSAVDHCHTSGKTRGLLCSSCNTSLGKFNDSPEMLMKALSYLKYWRNVHENNNEN